MKKLVLFLALLGLLALSVSTASAQSAKATFAYDELIAIPGYDMWTPILTQEIKMAHGKDLFIDVSLQSGIVTDTTVKSLNGVLSKSEARGTITVLVEIQDEDGNYIKDAMPNNGVDATNTPGADGDGIVFSDRIQTLNAKFAGLNCTADLGTGIVTCADPEELELILKTLTANSFNFVAADLDSGVYKVVVYAKTNISTDVTGASLASASAFIGAGSVSIESVRMIKGEVVEF